MLKITGGRGFQMTFENGWTVSVQFGAGNYCQNRDHDLSAGYVEREREAAARGSIDAEIAAWNADGTWHDFGHDVVKGWCTADEVAAFITMISQKS